MDTQNIGERLRQARGKLDISQAEFAKYFKTTQSTMCRWETGEIGIDHRKLFWIEHVLGTLGFVYAKRQRKAS